MRTTTRIGQSKLLGRAPIRFILLSSFISIGSVHVTAQTNRPLGESRVGQAEKQLEMEPIEAFGVTDIPVIEVEEMDLTA